MGTPAVNALVTVVSFTIILWVLSGPLTLLGVEIPRAMTFTAYLYVIIASVIAFRIGRPLITLNFLRERLNASFRYALVRLRENSESIAFHRGETVERAGLLGRFGTVIRRPLGDGVLFLSQQPYLPLGTLRTALAYPAPEIDDAQARAVLPRVQLPQLADRLDEEVDWSRQLSPEEQQRLGFAAVLLAKPRLVFLDEATSALDEGIEQTPYALLREELPEAVVVSVGHRSGLERFHGNRLDLRGDGRWATSELVG